MRIRLVMGPGGSGKGTFAARLAKEHDFYHISTGNIFRDAINSKTDLGLKVKETIDSGGVVDNETVNQLISHEIFKASKQDKIVLIDGYPRNMQQSMHLENLLYHKKTEVELAIIIDQPLMVLIDRVTNRRVCNSCGKLYNMKIDKEIKDGRCPSCGGYLYQRDEDQRDRYMKKYIEYVENTAPVIENFMDRDKILYIHNPEKTDISDWENWKPKDY